MFRVDRGAFFGSYIVVTKSQMWSLFCCLVLRAFCYPAPRYSISQTMTSFLLPSLRYKVRAQTLSISLWFISSLKVLWLNFFDGATGLGSCHKFAFSITLMLDEERADILFLVSISLLTHVMRNNWFMFISLLLALFTAQHIV